MLRTRSAILEAAAGCVERYGVRKTTMSDVASTASVAKATLYNHFRTKEHVLAALLAARLEVLIAECAAVASGTPSSEGSSPNLPAPGLGRGLEAALLHAAGQLASSRPLRRVVSDEPAVLARIAVPGAGRPWLAARAGVSAVLAAAGKQSDAATVDVVLRWLLGQLAWPGTREEVRLGAGLLARGIGRSDQDESGFIADGPAPAVATESAPAQVAPTQEQPRPGTGAGAPAVVRAGLGWPV